MNNSTKSLLYCALAFYFFATRVSGVIDCHYCGIRKLCTLPYDDSFSEKISCAKSCMKFDGKSLMDDRRVLVRTCGVEDINRCDKNVTYLGARGTFCVCNGINCNSGIQLKFCCICFALIILLHFLNPMENNTSCNFLDQSKPLRFRP